MTDENTRGSILGRLFRRNRRGSRKPSSPPTEGPSKRSKPTPRKINDSSSDRSPRPVAALIQCPVCLQEHHDLTFLQSRLTGFFRNFEPPELDALRSLLWGLMRQLGKRKFATTIRDRHDLHPSLRYVITIEGDLAVVIRADC